MTLRRNHQLKNPNKKEKEMYVVNMQFSVSEENHRLLRKIRERRWDENVRSEVRKKNAKRSE
jgi:hypothetical protein